MLGVVLGVFGSLCLINRAHGSDDFGCSKPGRFSFYDNMDGWRDFSGILH